MATPEGEVEDHLVAECDRFGFVCLKVVSPGRRGALDRLLVGNGLVLFCELKRPHGGVLSKAQKRMVARLEAQGAHVRLVRTTDEADLVIAEMINHQPTI